MWDLNFGTWISHKGLHNGLRPRAPTSIYKFTTSVHDGVWVSRRPGPACLVRKIFFQNICGFRAKISCSQSFLSKDLWFPSSAFRPTGPGRFLKRLGPVGRNFLFPKFSFKRSVVSGPEFPVPRGRPISGRTVAMDSS